MRPAPAARAFFARVIAAYGRRFLVADDGGRTWLATRRGKRGDVVVGDRVNCSAAGADGAVIESIEPRRSVLLRADAQRTKEVAANIDQVAIVFAAQPAFNVHFVWRALVAARAAGIGRLAVLNKTDLPDSGEARAALEDLAALGERTIAVSARAEPQDARTRLAAEFAHRVTLLIGQSGMGKSTILNLLVPDANARTREYSAKLNQGKQTTTASRWFAYGADGAIVDSPGFQAFGLAHLSVGQLAACLPDFASYLGQCRFNDCRHLEEPGCAVRAAVDAGAIAPARYAFYRVLATEVAR
ncbi:MAG: ribosome small subunit-dependent GTPase A [Burkholderiaceae bacterium]